MTKLIQQRDGWAKKAQDWSYKAAEYKNRLNKHGLYKRASSSSENESKPKVPKYAETRLSVCKDRFGEQKIKTKLHTALQLLSKNNDRKESLPQSTK